MTTDNIRVVAALTLPGPGTADRWSAAHAVVHRFLPSRATTTSALRPMNPRPSRPAEDLEDQRTAITGRSTRRRRRSTICSCGPARTVDRAEGALWAKMLTWSAGSTLRRLRPGCRSAEEAARAQREAAEAEARKLAEVAQAQAAEAAKAQEAGNAQAAAIAEAAAQRARDEASAAASAAQMAIAAPVDQDRGAEGHGHQHLSRLGLRGHVADRVGAARREAPRVDRPAAGRQRGLRAYVKGVGLACNLPGVHLTAQTTMSAPRGLDGRAMNPSAFLPRSITRLAPTAWTAAPPARLSFAAKAMQGFAAEGGFTRGQRPPTNGPTPCCANKRESSLQQQPPTKGCSCDESIPHYTKKVFAMAWEAL